MFEPTISYSARGHVYKKRMGISQSARKNIIFHSRFVLMNKTHNKKCSNFKTYRKLCPSSISNMKKPGHFSKAHLICVCPRCQDVANHLVISLDGRQMDWIKSLLTAISIVELLANWAVGQQAVSQKKCEHCWSIGTLQLFCHSLSCRVFLVVSFLMLDILRSSLRLRQTFGGPVRMNIRQTLECSRMWSPLGVVKSYPGTN